MNNLVKRFNKTLKSMLKRVVQRNGKDCDYLLPVLLFVPKHPRDFHSLAHGLEPHGLLALMKETWEVENISHKTIVI